MLSSVNPGISFTPSEGRVGSGSETDPRTHPTEALKGAEIAEVIARLLAKCFPSWLPSPEIRTALHHDKPFLPVGSSQAMRY